MYTSADRETLLADLVAFSKKRPDVLSFILVGSGARGFTDQYSDLDVLLVAKEKEDVAAVQEACAGFLNEHYSILKQKVYHHRKDIIVSCFFSRPLSRTRFRGMVDGTVKSDQARLEGFF